MLVSLAPERTLTNILVIVVILARHLYTISGEVDRVEANSELPDEVNVATSSRHGFDKLGCSRSGDCSEIVNEVIFRHADFQQECFVISPIVLYAWEY